MRLKYGTRRNRVINYNDEVPFEKRPAIGFYDTSNEVADPSSMNFKRLRMDEVDEKRRDEEESRERKGSAGNNKEKSGPGRVVFS